MQTVNRFSIYSLAPYLAQLCRILNTFPVHSPFIAIAYAKPQIRFNPPSRCRGHHHLPVLISERRIKRRPVIVIQIIVYERLPTKLVDALRNLVTRREAQTREEGGELFERSGGGRVLVQRYVRVRMLIYPVRIMSGVMRYDAMLGLTECQSPLP